MASHHSFHSLYCDLHGVTSVVQTRICTEESFQELWSHYCTPHQLKSSLWVWDLSVCGFSKHLGRFGLEVQEGPRSFVGCSPHLIVHHSPLWSFCHHSTTRACHRCSWFRIFAFTVQLALWVISLLFLDLYLNASLQRGLSWPFHLKYVHTLYFTLSVAYFSFLRSSFNLRSSYITIIIFFFWSLLGCQIYLARKLD